MSTLRSFCASRQTTASLIFFPVKAVFVPSAFALLPEEFYNEDNLS